MRESSRSKKPSTLPTTNEPTREGHGHHGHGHLFGSSDAADSAGQPWAGRSFEANPWAGDDGTIPAVYAQAIANLRALPLDALSERAQAQRAVVDSIRDARFLIPLLAEAGDVGFTDEGFQVDKTQELAIVTVAGPSGQRVLPVFSSAAAMTAWNPDARPVPAEGRRVALAAAADDAQWVVIDPTSETEFVVRRPAVEAIAKGEPWLPSSIDPEIDAVLVNSMTGDFRVRHIALLNGDPDSRGMSEELVVQVQLVGQLTQEELDEVVSGLTRRWAEIAVLGSKIDSLRIQLVAGS